MSDLLYAVCKTGYWRQEIVAVCTKKAIASELAIKAISREYDDYHKFEILSFIPNTRVNDGDLIELVSRTGTSIQVETKEQLNSHL